MDVLITLPGLHRVHRGAEVALESIAAGLARRGFGVTVVGSGPHDGERPYTYRRIPTVDRSRFERWPSIPLFREPASYESAMFNAQLAARIRLDRFDVSISCGFPWDNVALRRPTLRGRRPPHVFVTENGDWPALVETGDARLFDCDGLVCTNPIYLRRNASRWNAVLIPNGVDLDRFTPGPSERPRLGLPHATPIVLMVSALISSKRVREGIDAVARHPTAVLVVAGTGPLATELSEHGARVLGGRYVQTSFDHADMPALYRSVDLLLHLTKVESFGNVYIEAMATGLPVVAHRSEVTEWIAGSTACLVDTDDTSALADGLSTTLAVGRLDGAGDRIDRVRQRFSWPAVVDQYDAFLHDTVR